MNKVYKLIWNAVRQSYVPTSEKTQSKGKSFSVNLLTVVSLTSVLTSNSYANDTANDLKNDILIQKSIINQSLNLSYNDKYQQNFINQRAGISPFANTKIITISNDIENASDGYDLSTDTNTTDLTFNQAAGSITGQNSGVNISHGGIGSSNIMLSGVITGKSDNGLVVKNTDTTKDLKVTQMANSTIQGKNNGIEVENKGNGTTTLTTSGQVVGEQSNGIQANNDKNSKDLKVIQLVGSISGGANGIYANNSGLGSTSVTTSGEVIGAHNEGIYVHNDKTAKDINVTQMKGSSIKGYSNGASIINDGIGSTLVNASGNIEGQTTNGMFIINYEQTEDLTVNQIEGTIHGSTNGINMNNYGRGSTLVTTSGNVIGDQDDGLFNTNDTNAHDLTLNQLAGKIQGKRNGINMANNGKGSTYITTLGEIIGTENDGLYSINGNSSQDLIVHQSGGTVHGKLNGINLANHGNGSTTINSVGDVIGDQNDGMYVANDANTQDLTIKQNSGKINGNLNGINLANKGKGSTFITTKGTVIGNLSDGMYAINENTTQNLIVEQSDGSIQGNKNGINMANKGNGSTQITTSGEVIGKNNDGMYAFNDINTQNITVDQKQGKINGNLNGINLANKGKGSTFITTKGTVIGNLSDGMYAINENTTQNLIVEQSDGSIQGNKNGINMANKGNGSTQITTSGEIIGKNNDGMYAFNDINTQNITVNQEQGKINGNLNGINMANSGKGSTTINTSGEVIGNQNDGLYSANQSNTQHLTINQSAGSIKGNKNGINIANHGNGSTSISTAGTIKGQNNDGMYALNGAKSHDLTVKQSSGDIYGELNGINMANNGLGDTNITTLGSVTGAQYDGLYAVNDVKTQNMKINHIGGDITGKKNGINITNKGQGSSYITLSGNVTGSTFDAVVASNHTTAQDLSVILDNNATIQGQLNGINLVNKGHGSTSININGSVISHSLDALIVANDTTTKDLTFSLQNHANIQGSKNGVNLTNQGQGSTTITVEGNIKAGHGDAISASNKNNAQHLYIDQKSTSSITSSENGINVTNLGTGFSSVTVSGKVNGDNGSGILVKNGNTSSDLILSQTAGSIIGLNSGINVTNNGTGFTRIDIAGTVIGKGENQLSRPGAGIYSSGNVGTKTYLNLNAGADVSAVIGASIKNEISDAIITLNDGSKVSGLIQLGTGNNTLTIHKNANVTDLTIIDGGSDVTRNAQSTSTDTLNLYQNLTGSSTSTGRIGDVSVLNWENINVGQAVTFTLTGDLDTQNLNLNSDAVLKLQRSLNQATVNGNVNNAGTITLSNANAGENLIINGDYVGNNGKLILDTVVQGSESDTDRLNVNGHVTGKTQIQINNVNGIGADTTNTNGIKIVNVTGSSTNDAFNLQGGHLEAGAYEYYLYKGDLNKQNENWYLRSYLKKESEDQNKDKTNNDSTNNHQSGNEENNNDLNHIIGSNHEQEDKTNINNRRITYRKQVPLYSAVGEQLRQADIIMLSNLHQRIGNTPTNEETNTWGRIIAARNDIKQNGVLNTHSKGNHTGLQLGSDIWQTNHWRFGAYWGYLYGDLKVNGFASGVNGHVGKNTTNTYFIGAYGTYTHDDGCYVDLVLQAARHKVNIKPNSNADSKQKGYGGTASVEFGKPFTLFDNGWKLEPQAQIIHQWLDLDKSHIKGNTTVKHSNNNAWLFRIGGRVENEVDLDLGTLRPYARANLFYSPNGDDHTHFATPSYTTSIRSGASQTSTELAIGGSFDINNQLTAYGELGHTWSNGGNARVKAPINGSIGIKANW